MVGILKVIVEKIMDAALTDQGIKGALAQLLLFVLGACVAELMLYVIGMQQFRLDTGVIFTLLCGVNILVLQVLPVKNPRFWLSIVYVLVFVVGVLSLAYRVVTGNWAPIIPEYVP